jgi:hypothetical protein
MLNFWILIREKGVARSHKVAGAVDKKRGSSVLFLYVGLLAWIMLKNYVEEGTHAWRPVRLAQE